jgi:large subunit ribosomal protein L15
MVHNKRKKNSRQRASWTHGWGEKKKHRGAGSRGGKGNAGSGKRGDAKKPTYQNAKRVFGRNGFFNHGGRGSVSATNVGYFDNANLKGKPGVEFKKDVIVVDLAALGYQKLLGSGSITGKYQVTADFATDSAVAKVKAAGGSVTVLQEKKEKPKKAEAPVEESLEEVPAKE